MTFQQFRMHSEAASRAHRRAQVAAMVAARAAQLEDKAFKSLMKSMADG